MKKFCSVSFLEFDFISAIEKLTNVEEKFKYFFF